MTADQHLMTIFSAALDRGSDTDRAAYLTDECGSDTPLRGRVEALLRAHAAADGFLDRPPPAPGPVAGDLVGGRYKLLERIGEGGMGEVWLAEQTEPVRRRVAVKLVKPGMDTRGVLARFDAERQALAVMDHPNIARVLDGGATVGGRPFFVMELVKGVPITNYCDAHRLTPRDRLSLFVGVCAAVQHAHQKGVIHRDLKPSNVLVAPYDGVPVVKVIDFGVAKAAGQPLTDKTLFTGMGAVVGTPEYMSPEQAELNNADIDTRSDVYSLGVLLYELLAGSTPFTRKELETVGVFEMLRVIRETDPVRPSSRLSTADGLPTLAASRGTEPKRLAALVRGELDWIVMKALEKDRGRRYETADALAADLRRHLADEPVAACPPSAAYRLRKFARRNRGAVLAAAVALLLLVGGTVGTTIGMVRAKRERDEKETARGEALAHFTTARRAIGRLSQVAGDHAAFEPGMQQLWHDLLREVTEYYQELARTSPDDPVILEEMGIAYGRIGLAHQRLREKDQALATLRQAVEILERLSSEGTLTPAGRVALFRTYQDLGWTYDAFGRRDEFAAAHRQALAVAERLAADFPNTPQYRNLIGDACTGLGFNLIPNRPGESEALFRRAIKVLDTPEGNRHHLGKAYMGLAELFEAEGRLSEAEAYLLRAIDQLRTAVRESPRLWQMQDRLGETYRRHARVLGKAGRSAEAEQVFRQAVELWVRLRAQFSSVPRYADELIMAYAGLVPLLVTADMNKEAGEVYRKLLPLKPSDHTACDSLAWLLATCSEGSFRDPVRAIELAQQAKTDAPRFGRYWRTLGVALYRAGENEQAIDTLNKAMKLGKGGDANDWFFLAMAYRQLGELTKAWEWYDKAVEWMDKYQPKNGELLRFKKDAEEVLEIADGSQKQTNSK